MIGPTDGSANPRIYCTLSSVGSRCYPWVLFSMDGAVKLLECYPSIKCCQSARMFSLQVTDQITLRLALPFYAEPRSAAVQ